MSHIVEYCSPDFGAQIKALNQDNPLVVQPRMGMASPGAMAAGIHAVTTLPVPTAATLTLDSYTRVGAHDEAAAALQNGDDLNGFPIVAHGHEVAAAVAAAASGAPIQIRHGSADPRRIFEVMAQAGLTASEGGPVSYCLPYGRVPLRSSIVSWSEAVHALNVAAPTDRRVHLETFGGCMLGQLCPPSLLISLSLLEAMYFAELGTPSVSLSYAQQTSPYQDVEALAALRHLAGRYLPATVDYHLVSYTYMGVYPRAEAGAQALLDRSAHVAVGGGADRLIVKTAVEAQRIPTVEENLAALSRADLIARRAVHDPVYPSLDEVDYSEVVDEADRLITAVLQDGSSIAASLESAFASGILDVPYCLHQDNRGEARTVIAPDGRLAWDRIGRMPLPAVGGSGRSVTSQRLLDMLNFQARQFDTAALTRGAPAPSIPSPRRSEQPDRRRTVAVVGSGPRGISVLERLAARVRDGSAGELDSVVVIDSHAPGAGRIWRPDQPTWFLMNTPCGEVTLFSGEPDGGPERPGAGRSLAEWWSSWDRAATPMTYAPRAVFGQYLQHVFSTIGRTFRSAGIEFQTITATVTAIRRDNSGQYLLDTDGHPEPQITDTVVLTTGHAPTEPSGMTAALAHGASGARHRYVGGDSAADLPLDAETIRPGEAVGTIGLGLSFYDIMASFTLGRGGQFIEGAAPSHDLEYVPSGDEPILIAGSRSGLPVPARGRNQKPADHRYVPTTFTGAWAAKQRSKGVLLNFNDDVLPRLLAEVELVYLDRVLNAAGDNEGRAELERLARALHDADAAEIRSAQVDLVHGRGHRPTHSVLDLTELARPFAGTTFADREQFTEHALAWLRADLADAELGNFDGPIKAAMDCIRDVRGVLRQIVDFGGLTSASYRDEFQGDFVSKASFLTAGPPTERLRQVAALIECGVVQLIGPSARFSAVDEGSFFRAGSAQIRVGDPITLPRLIDARIPTPDLQRTRCKLWRSLHQSGRVRPFVSGSGDESFATGGVDLDPISLNLRAADGSSHAGIYVHGIPTEGARWFTQVGGARPGRAWDGYFSEADRIADNVLRDLTAIDLARDSWLVPTLGLLVPGDSDPVPAGS